MQTEEEDSLIYDVAIVGQGAVGLILSHLLAEAGHSVLCIEKSSGVSTVPRAIVLEGESLLPLKRLNLLQNLTSTMLTIDHLSCFDVNGKNLGQVPLDAFDNGHLQTATFSLPTLEQQLLERSRNTPGITLRLLHTLENYDIDDDLVYISAYQNLTRETFKAKTRYLIGCDGENSTVRRLCGVDQIADPEVRQWLVCDVFDPAIGTQELDEPFRAYCQKEHNSFAIARNNSEWRFEFVLPEYQELPEDQLTDDNAIRHRIRSIFPLSSKAEIKRKFLYTTHSLLAAEFYRERILLAGDAAHVLPPFVGIGLNNGIRDVVNLFWRLTLLLEDHGGKRLLKDYDVERRTGTAAAIQFTKRFARSVMPDEFVSTMMRDFNAWQARIFQSKDNYPTLLEKPAFDLSSGTIVSKQVGGKSLTGYRMPAGHVQSSAGGNERLYDLLFGHFSILGIDVDPLSILDEQSVSFWRRRGGRFKCLSPATPDAAILDGHYSVPENSPLSDIVKNKKGHVLLVRPDLFVLAEFSKKNASETLKLAASLFD